MKPADVWRAVFLNGSDVSHSWYNGDDDRDADSIASQYPKFVEPVRQFPVAVRAITGRAFSPAFTGQRIFRCSHSYIRLSLAEISV